MPIFNPSCGIAYLEAGQSTSILATSGVDVRFEKECAKTPHILITSWQKDTVWITEVTTTGFSWEGDDDNSIIEWIAVVDNG